VIDESSRETFTAATYNIHRAVGRDRRRDPSRVARVIKSLDADIVALQEVDAAPGLHRVSAQMTDMAAAGHYLAIPGPTMIRSQRSYGNVLLTRFHVEQVKRFDLSVAGREPRGAIDTRLRAPHGQRLRCIVTHFGLSARERRCQLEMLLHVLDEDWDYPLLLMGDFNGWFPFSRVERKLSRLMGRAPRLSSFPSRLPLLALDRIWIRPNRLLVDVRANRSLLSRDASDHLPVLARFRLPGGLAPDGIGGRP
jgi:endonuclease/exonuclease/phosphatase family metal-dependent hydrolase